MQDTDPKDSFGLTGTFKRVYHVLFEPSRLVTRPDDRRQAQLLSSLLLLLTLMAGIGGAASYTAIRDIAPMMWGIACGLAAAYALSRTRHFMASAVLAMSVMSGSPFAAVLLIGQYDVAGFSLPFLWSVLSLILGQVFLSQRGLAGLIIANVGGLLLLALVPGVSFVSVLHPLGVILPASLLLLIASWHRDLVERDRLQETQARLQVHHQRLEEVITELSTVNAELARASRLKDEFLANMSHELRTPLNTVIGMAEILAEEVYGPLTERQHESVAMIETSGQHLLDLINDILDLSKIGAGKLSLDIRPVSVDAICQASLRLIRQPAAKKRITVETQLDDEVIMVQVDQRRVQQILVNLLSNAVKFTPEQGRVGLQVSGDANKRVVRFIVWDTGSGISEEDLERLFRPFVQLDSGLARQHSGTGLGLSLVYRLTEMHGGSVGVESTPGQGSRFTVSLPWRPEEQRALVKGEEEHKIGTGPLPPIRHPPPLILLAEDNEDSLKTLSDYLRIKHYQVSAARNGQEALEQASQQRPAVILMDIQMPVMNGLDAIRLIRNVPGLADVPIIALTALAMPGDQEQCLAAGANTYLSKPVSPSSLVEAIESFLEPVLKH